MVSRDHGTIEAKRFPIPPDEVELLGDKSQERLGLRGDRVPEDEAVPVGCPNQVPLVPIREAASALSVRFCEPGDEIPGGNHSGLLALARATLAVSGRGERMRASEPLDCVVRRHRNPSVVSLRPWELGSCRSNLM